MLGEGVQRNTITYSAAISACEKGEQWQQALELFERMRGECVQRNTITYSAAISACGKGGQWQQALVLYEIIFSACRKGAQAVLTLGLNLSLGFFGRSSRTPEAQRLTN